MNKKKLLIIISAIIVTVGIVLTLVLMINKKATTYKISFETDGGTIIESQIVNEGEKIKKPVDPSKDGYTFIGWFYKDKIYDFSKVVNSNLILYAKWNEKKADTYIVKFETEGGTPIPNQIIEKGNKIQKPNDPTKDGYVFDGWFLNDENYDFETIIENDIQLKAKWVEVKTPDTKSTKNNNSTNNTNSTTNNSNNNANSSTPQNTSTEKKYVVTFNSNGGTTVNSQTIVEGSKATRPSNPTKKGYKFIAWTLNGSIYNFDTVITKEIELTATWIKNPTISYQEVGNYSEGITCDVSIDYQSYRVENNNILSGWELYVTSDNAVGDEMFIDGIGYFLHSTNGKETIRPVDVDYGDTHRYRARVYIDTENGRVYSDWSNIISIHAA